MNDKLEGEYEPVAREVEKMIKDVKSFHARTRHELNTHLNELDAMCEKQLERARTIIDQLPPEYQHLAAHATMVGEQNTHQ